MLDVFGEDAIDADDGVGTDLSAMLHVDVDAQLGAHFLVRTKTPAEGVDEIEVEIAPNTRVRVVKATLTEVVGATGKPAND